MLTRLGCSFPIRPNVQLTLRCASLAIIAALALTPTVARAQNYKDVAPQPVPAAPPKPAPVPPLPTDLPTGPAATKVIIPAVKALVFVPGVANVVKKGAVGKGVEIKDLPLLDDPAFLAAVTPFIGQKLTLARITEITREVVKQYRAKDHPLVDVIVPEPGAVTVTGGALDVGGLVGFQQGNGQITSSSSLGAVAVTGTGQNVGGLVGKDSASAIATATTSSTVTSSASTRASLRCAAPAPTSAGEAPHLSRFRGRGRTRRPSDLFRGEASRVRAV